MAINAFRHFANSIRQPAPYFPIVSEAKGAGNLIIGTLQLAISVYMRYSNNPRHNALTGRHIQIGTEALQRAAVQLTPALLVGVAKCGYERFSNSTISFFPLT